MENLRRSCMDPPKLALQVLPQVIAELADTSPVTDLPALLEALKRGMERVERRIIQSGADPDLTLATAQGQLEMSFLSLTSHLTELILTKCPASSVCLTARSCTGLCQVSQRDTVWAELRLRDEAWQLDGGSVPMAGARSRYQQHRERIPTRRIHQLTGHTDEVLHLAFSHSGDMLCTASRDRSAILWEMGEDLRAAPTMACTLGIDEPVVHVSWSPDDSLLVLATHKSMAHVYRKPLVQSLDDVYTNTVWPKVATLRSYINVYDLYPVFGAGYLLYGMDATLPLAHPAVRNAFRYGSEVHLKVWSTSSIDDAWTSSSITLPLGGPSLDWQKEFYHMSRLCFQDSHEGHLLALTGTNDSFCDTIAIVPVNEVSGSIQATGSCNFLRENGAIQMLHEARISPTESGFVTSVRVMNSCVLCSLDGACVGEATR